MVYEVISSNINKSILIILLFVIIIILIGYVFGEVSGFGIFGLIFAIILAGFTVFGSYYYSDKIILSLSKAVSVNPNEYPYLYNTVEGLSIAAGIPVPKIFLIDDTAPNAFATGRNPKNSAIVFTTGLIEKLNRLELEGVIGHEMSHIKNYDILLASLSVVLVGTVSLISDWMLRNVRWSKIGGKGKGYGGSLGIILLIIAILLAILSPLIAKLLHFTLSRQREYLADASSALLTKYPDGLASALEKISKDKETLEVANKSTAHLFIVNPFLNIKGKINDLFNTHPPVEERIRILKLM